MAQARFTLRSLLFFSYHNHRLFDRTLADVGGLDGRARFPAEHMLDSLVEKANDILDKLVWVVYERCMVGALKNEQL